jgi:hypothetical protein
VISLLEELEADLAGGWREDDDNARVKEEEDSMTEAKD